VAGSLTYANAAGLLLAMVAPLAVTLEGVDERLRRVAVFLVLTALVGTMSRGPILAVLVVLPILPRRCLRAAAWPAVVALAAGAVLVATAAGAGPQPLVAVALVVGLAAAARQGPRLGGRALVGLLAGVAV